MKKVKVLLVLAALVVMVTVASIAHAATFTVGASVTSTHTFTPCASVTIPAMSASALGTPQACNVVLWATGGTEQDVEMQGTDNGLYNTSATYSWTRLLTGSSTLTAGTEAWGFNLQNTGSYTVGTNDTGLYQNPDGLTAYDAGATTYHTVEPVTGGAADQIIDGNTPLTTSGSNFDIYFNAATDTDTLAGSYSETVTVTELWTP